ncbi:MAG: hypothetical protein P8188_09690 [Gemmatimonadota bacterium]
MKRVSLVGVLVSTLLLAAAYGLAFAPEIAPRLAPVLLALGTAGILAWTLVLAAQRNGRLGVLWVPVVFIVLVVGGGLVALILLPPVDPADPTLIVGLPPRAALLMYGVGLLPTLVVPVAYALTFDRLTLSSADLERVRAAGRARRAPDPGDAGDAGEVEGLASERDETPPTDVPGPRDGPGGRG